jgi:hypothetical protein
MKTPTILPDELEAMAVRELAALPPQQLLEIDTHLTEVTAWVKKIQGRLNVALDQRYGEAARHTLHDAGRDFGTAHLTDGPLRVKFELSKKVSWDQKQLAVLAQRIVAAGDLLEDYIDVKLSVSETRYTHWPAGLREQFAAARTVATSKPSFTLTLDQGEGASS